MHRRIIKHFNKSSNSDFTTLISNILKAKHAACSLKINSLNFHLLGALKTPILQHTKFLNQ